MVRIKSHSEVLIEFFIPIATSQLLLLDNKLQHAKTVCKRSHYRSDINWIKDFCTEGTVNTIYCGFFVAGKDISIDSDYSHKGSRKCIKEKCKCRCQAPGGGVRNKQSWIYLQTKRGTCIF